VLYPLSYEGCGSDGSPRRYALLVPPTSVLVVDDDPVIVRLLQVNFELEGIHVTVAVDGEEGLQLAKANPPDVIISDIMMPKLNGLELLAALRAVPALAGIPIILLSAKAQAADVQRGMELGADDYVTKPFDPLELIDRVYKVLAKSRR
jgi:DNA-binding response OmpR family regulator